jgi:hypothetical protein
MNPIKKLHREAMNLLDYSELARIKGMPDEARDLLWEAYQNEYEAAQMMRERTDAEPTRSLLFRGAASLAMRTNFWREAEKLICMGLSGDAPNEIVEDLRDLLDEVAYRRHLSLRGYKLSTSEFQMSLAGSVIGLGMARKDEVLARIERTATIIYRTAQRTLGKSFTTNIPTNLKKELEIELSIPRAASFAVAFRISYIPHQDQPPLPGMGWPEQVIDELMTCMALVQNEDRPKLKERFKEEAYLNNFLGLSQLLAPDGERVKLVGFTAWKDGHERQVALDKPTKILQEFKEFVVPEPSIEVSTERVQVIGRLLMADSTNPKKGNQLQIVDEKNKKHRVIVKEGLGDIVRALWEQVVRVSGDFDGKQIINAEIESAS